MARRIKVTFRRRRECKTDYAARIALLKTKLPRIVIRKSNRYIITQIISSKEAQDFVLCAANSAELKDFGWTGSFKNTGAAYLTGFLIAHIAKQVKHNIKAVIADFGLYRSIKGSKLYAVLKGANDGGLEINFKTELAPTQERIFGKVQPERFKEIKEKIKTIKIKNKNNKNKK